MMRRTQQFARRFTHAAIAIAALASTPRAFAQQPIDEQYTRRMAETLQDSRITTELVSSMPYSATVPTPLDVLGSIIGEPGILHHSAEIYEYFDAIDAASPRVKVWRIGRTEEGRDMIVAAIADEATITRLDEYGEMLNRLTDPRVTSEEEARRLIGTAKPIYWITSGIHSPETGGPENLMEFAYRLAVDESPYVQSIRENVITFITPIVEVDGRDKQVDTYYFNEARPEGSDPLPLMYWGRYVQHDNNRDGIGQMLALTKNLMAEYLEWTPTVLHDLHEEVLYLYTSTGTGPYSPALDPIVIHEWWLLAQTEVLELTKRGVPGVWTYGFYDGWAPNYLFFIGNTHNAIGRFYEVGAYGPENTVARGEWERVSREWFRPNPIVDSLQWGPRNSTNITVSALLIALNRVAHDRELFLENYWLKNERSIEEGRTGDINAWVIPAAQRRSSDAADAMNALRRQGVEVHTADRAFAAGGVDIAAGDWIIRADQPYRMLVEMYFSLQNYPPTNPSPYDDTGWTFPLMRDIVVESINDTAALDQPMTLATTDVRAAGGIQGDGDIVVVNHTGNNNIVTFRFRFPDVVMEAAEASFEAGGREFGSGSIIIRGAARARLAPVLEELGLQGFAMRTPPAVATHDLDVPRIGYVHSWSRTQDEGWVRAAFDHYGIPYTYFGEPGVRGGNLRAKFDVIVWPHGGAVGSGAPSEGPAVPYRSTAEYPHLGTPDSTSDVRGGMGIDGLAHLYEFVRQGGTLIVEGGTAAIFPRHDLLPGIEVETPRGLFAEGTILRGVIADMQSPLVYGLGRNQMPVYFNQAPVLNASGLPAVVLSESEIDRRGTSEGRYGGTLLNPNSRQLELSPWLPDEDYIPQPDTAAERERSERAGRGRQRSGAAPLGLPAMRPRVVLRFPSDEQDMLLSGGLAGGSVLAGRAQLVDSPVGAGHVVSFAIRPFWRWQTQGTFILGFNALMHWNDLDAGRTQVRTTDQ